MTGNKAYEKKVIIDLNTPICINNYCFLVFLSIIYLIFM